MGQAVYAAAQANQQAAAGAQSATGDQPAAQGATDPGADEVVDAEIVDDEKKD